MRPGLLLTDGYKFSMGEAGWPLRDETFHLTHRRGGLQVLPFDVEKEVRELLPSPDIDDWQYLASCGYEVGAGYRAAFGLRHLLRVRGLPRFSVFHDREPIVSISGPSALVSWLEPLVLQWNYRIQVASEALRRPGQLDQAVGTVTCERQRELVLETLDAVQVKPPDIRVDAEGYVNRVRQAVRELVEIVGDPARLFEVGLRSATCPEQHRLALEACRTEGLRRTSNVWGARELGLVAVGTMGHEHVQRFGSDPAAFRAMVERRPQPASFLLDTFDTITSGLPAAFAVMREHPGQRHSIRYDSGDKVAQYRTAVHLAKQVGLNPVHILEDGFDAEQTRTFERLRAAVGVSAEDQLYGYGGALVATPGASAFTRDRVSAVFKLSQTGSRPTMKFGNESTELRAGAPEPRSEAPAASVRRLPGGKQSLPGRPVLFRRKPGAAGPFGIAGQEGEPPPRGYELVTSADAVDTPGLRTSLSAAEQVSQADRWLGASVATQALIDALAGEALGRGKE